MDEGELPAGSPAVPDHPQSQQEITQGPAPTVDAAFSAFYLQFTPTLVGFLIWQGARLPDAADLAQATMSEAYRHWSTIREPKAWARRVASRALARHIASVEEDPVDGIPEHSSDRTVRLWNVSDPVRPATLGAPLIGHTDSLTSVAFSPDGLILATASDDQTVRLWDLTDRNRPRPLGPPLTGHTSTVDSVAFSPDGKTLATASSDRTVLLWDITVPTQPRNLGQALIGHSGVVRSVAFAPDGRTLATGSDDGTTRLWNLGGLNDFQDHAIERACSITKGGLSRDQWVQYIPGLPYENTCPS